MMETMTSRQRWLAALAHRPVDRLPFWPKIDQAYASAQQAPFQRMTLRELHAWIGSDPQEWMADGTRVVRTTTAKEHVRDGDLLRTIFRTPHAEMTLVEHWDAVSQSWHPVQHPVHDRETLHRMTEFFLDESWERDDARQAQTLAWQREVGEDAVMATNIGESPMMYFIEYLAGMENAHYFLCDYQADVEALFAAMHASLLRKTEIAAATSTADLFYFTENTSTTLLSPDQYRAYCVPFLRAYAEVLQAAGKLTVLHMCGHLKRLLPDIATLPVAAYEAFTSPPLGNTTLRDGRTACPHACLIGGTNAILWTRPAEEILAQLRHDLDELPHHRGLVVTSAGIMPPRATPETIKAVCAWVQAYPGELG